MKSTVTFKQYYDINEDMTSAALGGTSGFNPDNISGNDFYAAGDTRIPKGGTVYSRKGVVNRKRSKKSRKRHNKSHKIKQ